MKILKQLFIILLVSLLGELMRYVLPFPIPASIYGLVLMFAALAFKIVRPEQIRETAKFLIEIMPLMFVPAAVGLMKSWEVLRPVCVPVLVIMTVTTVIVMVVSGRVTQWVMGWTRKSETGEEQ